MPARWKVDAAARIAATVPVAAAVREPKPQRGKTNFTDDWRDIKAV